MRSPLRRRGPSVDAAAAADAAVPAPSPEAPGPLASAAAASSSEPSTSEPTVTVLPLPPPRTPLRSHVGANAALLAAARRRRAAEEEEENAAMNVDDDGEEEEEEEEDEVQTLSPHVDAVAAALLERFRAVADKRVSDAAYLLVGSLRERCMLFFLFFPFYKHFLLRVFVSIIPLY